MAKPLSRQPLTAPEIRVLELSTDGLNVREIAEALKLTESRVRRLKTSVRGKLATRRWSGCVAVAVGFRFIRATPISKELAARIIRNRRLLTATDVSIYGYISNGQTRQAIAELMALELREIDDCRHRLHELLKINSDIAITAALIQAEELPSPSLAPVPFQPDLLQLLTELIQDSPSRVAAKQGVNGNTYKSKVQLAVQGVGALNLTHATAIAVRTGYLKPLGFESKVKRARRSNLTVLQLFVLQELADGRDQTSIALELRGKANRLGSIMSSIYAKLRVHSQSQAVAVALWAGMLDQTVTLQQARPLLSDKQLRILAAMEMGLSYPQIGEKLGIPLGTINYHIPAILRRLGASTRHEAVEIARAQGLLPSG